MRLEVAAAAALTCVLAAAPAEGQIRVGGGVAQAAHYFAGQTVGPSLMASSERAFSERGLLRFSVDGAFVPGPDGERDEDSVALGAGVAVLVRAWSDWAPYLLLGVGVYTALRPAGNGSFMAVQAGGGFSRFAGWGPFIEIRYVASIPPFVGARVLNAGVRIPVGSDDEM